MRPGGRRVAPPPSRPAAVAAGEAGARGEPGAGGRPGGPRPRIPCRWDLAPAEAVSLQGELRARVRHGRLAVSRVRRVAGCDVAVAGDHLCAVALVYRLPEMRVVDRAEAIVPARFPYVPGLLSFRELPAILLAFERLRSAPEVVICDGQGVAHPRRFGLACHLGVLLDLPAIGCAKSRLTGQHDEPAAERGARVPLCDGGEVIGAVLRTRERVKPVFVSVGHRVTLEDAVRLVLRCSMGFRLPEPVRQADLAVGRLARGLAP